MATGAGWKSCVYTLFRNFGRGTSHRPVQTGNEPIWMCCIHLFSEHTFSSSHWYFEGFLRRISTCKQMIKYCSLLCPARFDRKKAVSRVWCMYLWSPLCSESVVSWTRLFPMSLTPSTYFFCIARPFSRTACADKQFQLFLSVHVASCRKDSSG